MAFIEVPRYHIGCDTPKCDHVLAVIEFDLFGLPIDHYLLETAHPVLEQPLMDMLIESEWIIIDGKVYCPNCSTSVTNSALITLKTDMGF